MMPKTMVLCVFKGLMPLFYTHGPIGTKFRFRRSRKAPFLKTSVHRRIITRPKGMSKSINSSYENYTILTVHHIYKWIKSIFLD